MNLTPRTSLGWTEPTFLSSNSKQHIQGVQIKFNKIAEVLTEAAVQSWASLFYFFGQS